ncbi:MAG: M20/M25/M40 family metallo-hydrolase [Ktedonobacteraceae bacterium]
MSSVQKVIPLYQRPAELLQNLIRFDTTNPPGNEAQCIEYINTILTEAGFETKLLAVEDKRPNLIARLQGRGDAPPLLLQGHVDVVTTANQHWQRSPFEGQKVDDYIWGRGTLDMKGGVAMMIAALLRAKAEGESLPGDVILAVVSDEESGGVNGAKYLVEHHADLFKDVRYALGEVGGFTSYIDGKKFYCIQVLEKQICWLKAILRGPGGHGSIPIHGGATAKLGRLLQQLDQHRLPVHITPVVHQMLETMADTLSSSPTGPLLRQLLNPAHANETLDQLGPRTHFFDPILHNTVNVTILYGGHKINVIPSEIVVEMDGRLLPGYSPDDMIHELHELVGNDIEFELMRYDEGRTEPTMGFYSTLADILHEADPIGIAVPTLMPAVTDGRFFSALGIQTYGFLPMDLYEGFDFLQAIHAADERIPIAALDFGTNAIHEALRRNSL